MKKAILLFRAFVRYFAVSEESPAIFRRGFCFRSKSFAGPLG